MFDNSDLAWAAGFFDGEGTFSDIRGTPAASMSQVGVECLDVFANCVGAGTIKGPIEKSTQEMNRQPQYIYYAYGPRARQVFSLLWPWLGPYKRAQGVRRGLGAPATASMLFAERPWPEQIAWCAGFFDAEGCFSKCGDGLNARINHTDQHLLERFQSAVSVGRIYGPYAPHKTSLGKSDYFVYTVSGFERVQALLAMLWPNLSSARRTKAMALLSEHRTFWKCGHRRGPVWRMHCPDCFKPGPKPGFKRQKSGQLTIEI